MKIFLDDIRVPTDIYPDAKEGEWTVARDVVEAQQLFLKNEGEVEAISFDNDLGTVLEGATLLNFIEFEAATDPQFAIPAQLLVHSANPVARARMEQAIASIERLRTADPLQKKTGNVKFVE